MIVFSDNVLTALEAATEGTPLLSTERGDFFALPDLPVGALRVRGGLDSYLDFVSDANKGETLAFLVPWQNPKFHVVVNTQVTVRGGKAFIRGKEFTLL